MAMIGGETIEQVIDAREGTVYLTKNFAWKVYGNQLTAYNVLSDYKDAEEAGVPVASAAKFTTLLTDGGSATTVGGIRSERLGGRFFQLSKAGGEAILRNEIAKILIDSRLQTVIAGLRAANEFGIADPQGFVNVGSDVPVRFIDIHKKGYASHDFDVAIETAERTLGAL